MARLVTGMVIASSTATMGTERGRRMASGHAATAANDTQQSVPAMERDIGGVLAAEYRSLIRYSRRLTANGPEAADLVHMVCARLLAKQTAIATVENLSGWLRTVLFHTFIDLRRRERWEIPTDSEHLDGTTVEPEEESAALTLTVDEVRALLVAVPVHFRVPYELFTFEEMPYARIAVVLGLTCKTVGTRINRARERLRQLIRMHYGV